MQSSWPGSQSSHIAVRFWLLSIITDVRLRDRYVALRRCVTRRVVMSAAGLQFSTSTVFTLRGTAMRIVVALKAVDSSIS